MMDHESPRDSNARLVRCDSKQKRIVLPPYTMIRVDQTSSDSPPETDVRASDHEPMLYCPVCSLRLTERKCKLLCEQCGYFMSCADYY